LKACGRRIKRHEPLIAPMPNATRKIITFSYNDLFNNGVNIMPSGALNAVTEIIESPYIHAEIS
jgi:hypothetical protein